MLEEVSEKSKELLNTEELRYDVREVLEHRIPIIVGAIQAHRWNAAAAYSETQLNNMTSPWQQILYILSQLNQHSSASNLNSYIDNAYQIASAWPNNLKLKGGAVKQAVKSFEKVQEAMSERITTLEKTIENKDLELKQQAQRYEENLAKLQEKLETLSASIIQTDNEIQHQRENISNLSITQNEKFDEDQQERRKQWHEWLEERKAEYDSKADEELNQLAQKDTDGQVVLTQIQELHNKVEKAAGKAAAAVIARGHGSYALRDWVAGMLLLTIGIIGIALAGVILIASVNSVQPDTAISWQWTALKITLTLLITTAATVAFTFSKRFFNTAAETKRIELELRSLEPFLSDINDTEKVSEIKADYIRRRFGENPDKSTKGKESAGEDTQQEAYSAVKLAIEQLSEIIKSQMRNGI